MTEEQEQAALLLERCRDKLSGHEIEVCESFLDGESHLPEDYVDDDEIAELEDELSEYQRAFDRAEEDLEEAQDQLDRAKKKRDQQDEVIASENGGTLTRLCTEFAEHLK